MANRLKNYISIAFHKPFPLDSAEGRAKERLRRIAMTAIAAAIAKVFATIIPFITIKLTLDYLGVELYGLWNAVTSFFALFVFADLGLGNGLQTLLSRSYGKDDVNEQRQIIWNTYLVLDFVAIILIVGFLCVYPLVNWAEVMNAQDPSTINIVNAVVLAIVIPKLLSVPLSLVQRVQLSYQEGYNSYWWQCLASVLSLLAIVIICKFNLGKVNLIWYSSVLPVIIFILNSVFYYRGKTAVKFSFVLTDKKLIKIILSTGFAFFLLSILTTLGLQIDTFIVAHVVNLKDATPFSILHKISSLISIVVGMLCTPLWSANGEALSRGDFDWVHRNTRKMSLISLGFALVMSFIIVCSSKFLFTIWLGADFEFSISCLIGMCGTQIILSAISPYFMVLNASGIVIKQIVIFSIYTICSLALKFWLAGIYGGDIIPWVSNICYLVCIVPFVLQFSHKVTLAK